MKKLFLLIAFLSPQFLFANIQVDSVTIGLDGYVRAERWVPVVFQLSSPGQRFEGKIQVRKGNTIFEKTLSLGETTRKRVELLYYHSMPYETLRYVILDQRGYAVRQGNLEPRFMNPRDNLVLVISSDEYNHQFLNGQPNPWSGKSFAVYYHPQDLFNEWMAYATADAIAIGSLSPSQLLPTQWKALVQYVASGGVLVCSARTDLAVLRDPLLRNQLPQIVPELTQQTNGDFLVSFWIRKTTETFPRLEIPVQTVITRPCDRQLVPLSSPENSLITASPYYKGSVTYFAFDYSQLPENIRNVFAEFWNRTIFPPTASGDPGFSQRFRQRLEENPRVQRDLYNIPGLKLPDLKWFALFFFIYICAIGPLQYFILNLLKKNSLLWVSFPAIILLFTVVSFGYSEYRQSGKGKITNVRVVEVFPVIGNQVVYEVYGAVMTESGTFDFQAASESSYLRKTALQMFNYQSEPFMLSEDLPRSLIGEAMKRRTFRSFDAFDLQAAVIPVSVAFDVRNGQLNGKVMNSSNFDLEDCFFMYDSRNALQLGAISAGRITNFSLPLKSDHYPPFAERQLRDLLQLYAASYSNPHFFFGTIRDSENQLVVNGRKRKTESKTYLAVYAHSPNATVLNPWVITQVY
jgi:hypothetical protein